MKPEEEKQGEVAYQIFVNVRTADSGAVLQGGGQSETGENSLKLTDGVPVGDVLTVRVDDSLLNETLKCFIQAQ